MSRLPILFSLLLISAALGDALVLSDGTRLEGQLKREDSGWTVIDAAGKATRVADDQVFMVDKSSSLSAEELASINFRTLRRWMDAATDPRIPIAHYEKFIEQNRGKPAADDATKELRIWKDRLANGMTKVGKTWMTPAERAEALKKIAAILDEVKARLQAGHLKEAEKSLKAALDLYADHPSVLFAQGVIDYRQNELVSARKDFDQAAAALKPHGPTLNNLAVVEFQVRSYALSLTHFDQAMQAKPKDRQILDNVAQALHDLPAKERSSSLAARVAKRFQEQDAQLQKQLKDQHLSRWGSTYVADDTVADAEKASSQIDKLTKDLNKLQARIDQIDKQIDANNRAMDRMQANRRRNNRIAGGYGADKRENAKLQNERADLNRQAQDLQRQIQKAEKDLPTPTYTTNLKIFSLDDMPAVDSTASGSN